MAGSDFRYDLAGKSALLAAFLKCFNDWKDALAPLSEDEYTVAKDFALQDEMRARQEPLLARMSRADLLWIYNNYLGTGMGKTTFRRKYLDTYAARHGRASKGSGDDLAAAIG